MDTQTTQFYSQNARQIAANHRLAEGGIDLYFAQAFTPGCSMLDIGCGSGRDLNALVEAGYKARGVEPCEEFRESVSEEYPKLYGRIKCDSLPNLQSIEDNSYDGVLCSAVLQHLPEELLFDSVYSIRRILKENGRLLISIPVDPTIENQRDDKGRLFNGVTPENFQLIFERIGFKLISRWDNGDSLGRCNRSWATMLFILESTDGSRSLDKIEGILNKDKKDATYKLALFRALADIAMTNYNSALWLPDGRVALPLMSIAEKWLEYYWPIIESDTFIPQKRGEKPGSQKRIAFRAQMTDLVDLYRCNGGLSAFSVDYRNQTLTKEIKSATSKLLSRLNSTIKDGPVYYSGGGGSKTFEYDKVSKSVIMDADIWRELSIMGSWITDATILRWAELTAQISAGEIKVSQIIDHLLVSPIPERDVASARGLYSQLTDKVCVWSDKIIATKFDVDHAIPYALWKNNDLWNLLPADPKVNNQKRDKLPSHDLLIARKDCIVDYWAKMYEEFENRFEFEAAKFAGKQAFITSNWENKLFAALTEAVEVTAIQRGVDRWQPDEIALKRSAVKRETQDAISDNTPELIEFPSASEQFVTCVPFYDITATAGYLDMDQFVDQESISDHDTWINVPDHHIESGMFAIQITGRSMEPKINDGDYCLFRAGSALGGSRQGRIVFVQHHSINDPDTNAQFTVKQYHSEKAYDENGIPQHTKIILKPLNHDYTPIVINHTDEENEFCILAEFISVL